jgi:tRNA-binding EMAP/Myf-like protein
MSAPIKPTVTIADVERLDVRVGTIVAVEDVPKSAKLLGFAWTSATTRARSSPA